MIPYLSLSNISVFTRTLMGFLNNGLYTLGRFIPTIGAISDGCMFSRQYKW